jgi:SagB-type dehydrogenase family enzyme
MNPTRRTVALAGGALLAGCRIGAAPESAVRARESARVVTLPAPVTGRSAGPRADLTVAQALAARRSVREFAAEELTASELGQLMWAAQGITHDGDRRAAPSAGALYPLRLYAVSRTRVLRYLPDGHRALEWQDETAYDALTAATPSAAAVAGAPVTFVVAAVVRRTARKYGGQSDWYVAVEIGHAVENLWLQAVALGLAGVTIGAVNASRVGHALALPAGERAHYLMPVGQPRTEA